MAGMGAGYSHVKAVLNSVNGPRLSRKLHPFKHVVSHSFKQASIRIGNQDHRALRILISTLRI